MNIEEFLADNNTETPEAESAEVPEVDIESEGIELDVQKAVVEELAADKAKLDVQLEELNNETAALKGKIEELEKSIAERDSKIADLERRLCDEQERHFDEQSRNPNALALLDRDVDLPDRFDGETRDHVIEVIREARDRAEAEGRVRRAQILEGVLVANEPNGTLKEKREELEKLFNENGNILTGPVMDELTRLNISYKNGEEYLLASEILKRTY